METVTDYVFFSSKITADGDCSHEIKTYIPWKESYDKPRQYMKKQRDHFANKSPSSQSYGFSSSHVETGELGHKEGWTLKNRCFRTAVLEKTLESPFNYKKIKSVHPKGNQPWIFTGRADGETEAPILWSPDVKSQLTGKDPDVGKDWGQEKGATEDEMAGWHYRLNGHEFEHTLGEVNDREAWCAAVHGFPKSRTMTEWLNNGSINMNRKKMWYTHREILYCHEERRKSCHL